MQIPLKGNDELIDASKAFNLMLDKTQKVTYALRTDNASMDAIINTVNDGIL